MFSFLSVLWSTAVLVFSFKWIRDFTAAVATRVRW